MGTLIFYRTYFLEENIADGDYGPDAYTESETHAGIGASEAAHLIELEGLSFAATGNDWAADPDGSYVTDYHTGKRCETSAHLDGFPERVHSAIINKVG